MYRNHLTTGLTQTLLFTATIGFLLSGPGFGQIKKGPDQTAQNSRKEWLQFGGPDGDFTVDHVSLADKWPKSGPPLLWKRELGEGFSSVSVSDGSLFTMYREGEEEIVVCLDARNGQTKWMHRYPSPFTRAMKQYGPGPHSTPLVSGDLVHTVGVNLVVHTLEKETGKVIWKKDLAKELGAKVPFRGHASSPISCGDMLILAAGVPNKLPQKKQCKDAKMVSLLALRKSDGKLIWTGLEGEVAYSTPVYSELAGTKQIILFMRKSVAAADPKDGKELWRIPVIEGHNVATPLTNGRNIFVTAAYESGGKLIELARKPGKDMTATEKWKSRWMRFDQGNAIWIDKYLVGTTGDSGPAFFVCIDAQTGKQVWRKRGYRRSTLVYADKKLIMLQENGKLQLIQFSADEGPTVLTEHRIKLTKRPAWTPPTLVGTTLFIRTRAQVMAFDLGKKP